MALGQIDPANRKKVIPQPKKPTKPKGKKK